MKDKIFKLNYSDEDYNCPNCGSSETVSSPEPYTCKCAKCGEIYETPDT